MVCGIYVYVEHTTCVRTFGKKGFCTLHFIYTVISLFSIENWVVPCEDITCLPQESYFLW